MEVAKAVFEGVQPPLEIEIYMGKNCPPQNKKCMRKKIWTPHLDLLEESDTLFEKFLATPLAYAEENVIDGFDRNLVRELEFQVQVGFLRVYLILVIRFPCSY